MTDAVAVALSGGVDSLAAACLLKSRGHAVTGVHFRTGYAPVDEGPIRAMARRLGAALHIIDLGRVFKQEVVDYFIAAYLSGRTPNPCLVCNPIIKFTALPDALRPMGISRIATGHYARIEKNADGACRLKKGIDPLKDQSYFLAMMTQSQLAAAVFPLGGLSKEDARRIVADQGLEPAARKESQDVCFIRNRTYGEFMAAETEIAPAPGPIEDVHGALIGEHRGLHLFTIGQRRGINCPAARPYYVLRLDTARNVLVVGFKEDLLSDRCRVTGINWINGPPDGPVDVQTRIRYRHAAAPSAAEPLDDRTAAVRFHVPQEAVTPGQGAVFYYGDVVLGGGWIE